jgi:O-antigen/teichoic acid export membrane protein
VHKKLLRYSKRPFVRNVITVASGTATAQAISMAFAPFITRLYGPEVFGLQSLFISLVGLFATVAALGYPTAIVLPKNDSDALGLAKLSIFISLGTASISSIGIYYFDDNILKLLNAEKLIEYSFLIPIATIFSIFSSVLAQWLIRKKQFSLTAKYSIATSALINSIKTVLGIINPTAMTLIATNVVGTVFSTAITWFGWYRLTLPTIENKKSTEPPTALKQLAIQHSDFPLLRTPQNLINALSQSLPVLLLSAYFGASSAGQYSLAITVLGIPASIIGGSVMSVFYPRITEAIRDGENPQKLILQTTLGMTVSGAIPFLIIVVTGPLIFKMIFGENWHSAGIYAQWLSIWIFFQYINRPAVSAIPALDLQGGLLIYEIFSSGAKILALWMGFVLYKDAIIAIALFSLSGTAAYIWLILWVLHCSKVRSIYNQ